MLRQVVASCAASRGVSDSLGYTGRIVPVRAATLRTPKAADGFIGY